MKSLDHMTEPELRELFRSLAATIKSRLPAGELFCLITFGRDQIGQYISNAERSGIIKSLREFADRLEAKEDVVR